MLRSFQADIEPDVVHKLIHLSGILWSLWQVDNFVKQRHVCHLAKAQVLILEAALVYELCMRKWDSTRQRRAAASATIFSHWDVLLGQGIIVGLWDVCADLLGCELTRVSVC